MGRGNSGCAYFAHRLLLTGHNQRIDLVSSYCRPLQEQSQRLCRCLPLGQFLQGVKTDRSPGGWDCSVRGTSIVLSQIKKIVQRGEVIIGTSSSVNDAVAMLVIMSI
jgi:hypothetical protein